MTAVVLISGGGTNLQAMIDAKIDIDLVVSNKPKAGGLERARKAGIDTFTLECAQKTSREEYDEVLALRIGDADHIFLAGWMRILSPMFVKQYENKIINIHPSLLPKYPGRNTHQRALDQNETKHGATIHFVDEYLDHGPVIMQGEVDINRFDIADDLALKVNNIEVLMYPIVARWFVDGHLWCHNNRIWLNGEEMETPIIC